MKFLEVILEDFLPEDRFSYTAKLLVNLIRNDKAVLLCPLLRCRP